MLTETCTTTAVTSNPESAARADDRRRAASVLRGEDVPSSVARGRAGKVRAILGLINALEDELCDAVGDRREADVAGGERETHRWIDQLGHARASCARMLAGPKACAAEFDAALAGLFFLAHEGSFQASLRPNAGWSAAYGVLSGFATVVRAEPAAREWEHILREIARVDRAGEVGDAWDDVRARIVAFEGGQGWAAVRDAVIAIAYAHEAVLAPNDAEDLEGWAVGEGAFLTGGDASALAAIGLDDVAPPATMRQPPARSTKRRKAAAAAKTSRRSRR